MKVLYESDDGKQFNSLEDCVEHEKHTTIMLNNELAQYIFYDEKWNIINTTLENVEEIYNDSSYIKVKAYTEALLNNEYGLCLPTEVGIYRYDNGWVSVSDELYDFLYNWHVDNDTYNKILQAFVKYMGDEQCMQ